MLETTILIKGLLIFLARVCDVTLGTIRTIVTVQGRSKIAFGLGLAEILIWLTAASVVITKIHESPILAAFYALGYATGNVVGIKVEQKIAFGSIILRVITTQNGKSKTMANRLREAGQAVTSFVGEGLKGQVTELYIVCRRRDLKKLLTIVQEEDPEAFYITEQAGSASKIIRPYYTAQTGWRAIFKRK